MPITQLPTPDHATSRQLEQAAASNHTELFCQNALARGGEVAHRDGMTYTYDGPEYQSMIAFPSLDPGSADHQLDEMMAWYASRPNKGIGCWSLDPPVPMDLGDRLKARGFQDGWRPCWMALGLGAMREDHAYPSRLQIVMDNEMSLESVKGLPYVGRDGAVSAAMLRYHPDRVRRFVALLKGKIVGHSAVFFSTGTYGAAGVYNVAVIPSARRQGIGKALVAAACLLGKEKGHLYAVLNATGRQMYEQMGFQYVGEGFTWWRF
ncbi:GNAT family N-acetyltransferase [Flavitalea sp. BT771]|uniref:GNAT family N-acetyltransferase n=1 Tax=Flavitalea sp. BT771 TaxID=3063329 RepID=UPI0026E3C251|nr:GNAT family N-acetyltransferase [Flavitalea sp. BT771]MDO6435495.1 GNAT family N-acetyltransferase [Flavitalea sp. BT771]MDV6224395.1 GNAT family N-acetyltransferase [Flavitalea sp. BT771]